MIGRPHTPERFGKQLWSRVRLDGSTSPLTHDEFEDALSHACALECADPTRLHYVWHALVALTPGIDALRRCLASAPAGFPPAFQQSSDGAAVLGSTTAWRTAFIASWGPLAATRSLDALFTCGLNGPGDAVALTQALAAALETTAPTMTWCELTERIAVLEAAELPWRLALLEKGTTSLEDRTTAWAALLEGPEPLRRALTLRHAGAPGTLAELLTALPVLALA